jgi:FkbM family methyltransferase
MNDLLTAKGIDSFATLLQAYQKAGVDLGNCVDGGAGCGGTAKTMLRHMAADSVCYAFEPFPGNLRFFEGIDPRVILVPKAMDVEQRQSKFRVPSVVQEDSVWGKKGMVGYSSVGHLTNTVPEGEISLDVECVRTDQVVPADKRIGFVKLDLQGGELNALKGMSRFLADVPLMWIEYTGRPDLMDYIIDQDFLVFDTEYFFLGSPGEAARDAFKVTRENHPLSNGLTAWFGFKRKPWRNYHQEFAQYKKDLRMLQTDLVCVNRRHLDDFIKAAQFL